MDTLKSLMDKHEYELVIKLTEKSMDAESIFYRISALLGIGQAEKALLCLKEHHNELHKNLLLLIKVHIDLLLILGKFDEAYEELDYYKNLPYESQQVEELLSSMVGHIREEERNQYTNLNKTTSDDEIKSRLKSNDKGVVISALDMAANRGVTPFLKEIKDILVSNPHQALRSFALMILVQRKHNEIVTFKSKNGVIEINPSKLKAPFVGESFNRISKRMISEFKNPSISDNAINIFSSYIIDIYPDDIRNEDDDIIAALYMLSCDCLQIKDIPSLEEYCKKKLLNELKVKRLYNEFAKIVQDL